MTHRPHPFLDLSEFPKGPQVLKGPPKKAAERTKNEPFPIEVNNNQENASVMSVYMSAREGGGDHLSGQCSTRCHHNQMSSDKCRDLLQSSNVQI